MRWHDVLWIIGLEVFGDDALAEIYGNAMRQKAEGQEHIVPGLTWFIVSDSGSELWEPCVVQFDQFTESQDELTTSESRLRTIFDRPLPVTFADPSGARDLHAFCKFSDGASLVSPDRDGYFGRAARFRFVPVRDSLRAGRST